MSLNKGKAKAKPTKKTTAATAGIPKRAVMNRRKYNEAISGDTTSNYAMYKGGGKVKKYQAGGNKTYVEKAADRMATDQSDLTKYVIRPAVKALDRATTKGAELVKKYGPRVMEAGSKMERGPKIKKGGTTRKYKSGGSKFPDLTGDGKVTQADILKGRGVFKKGGSAKKKK